MHRILSWFLLPLLGLVAVAGGAVTPGPERVDPRFEFLKGLAGRWSAAAPDDGGPALAFEFRVTAGGHAVEEREMIDTPHEMLTVYYMDGGDLVATHYCMLGNRPRAKAAGRVVHDALRFDCAGTPGGARSHDEEHVHRWTMRLDGEGRLHYAAELRKDDATTETPDFVLNRR